MFWCRFGRKQDLEQGILFHQLVLRPTGLLQPLRVADMKAFPLRRASALPGGGKGSGGKWLE